MIRLSKKYFPAVLFMLLILVIGATAIFSGSMDTYPAYVHAWTQSDRVALAQNFQVNGFDLFHPATYNLLTKDGITQVDFPIHDYLVAVISTTLDSDLISTFRWYVLIISLIGILYFFLTLLLYTKSTARAIFGATFIFTLPFLVYYENGFLPSAPSFSFFLIGLFYVLNTIKTNGKTAGIGILFLTIAALTRLPFFIFLFAFFLLFILEGIRSKKFELKKILLFFIGISLVISYYFYNRYLASTYGSMFLSNLLYFKSFADFKGVLSVALNRWGNQIMSPYHAILFAVFLVAAIYQVSKKGIKTYSSYRLTLFSLISSIGVTLFFFAFGKQFADHDYYYIDSFLPLLVLFLIFGLTCIEISRKWYTPIGTICGIFFFYFFSYAAQNQKLRYSPTFDDKIEYAYSTYLNAKTDIEKWGVERTDTLFILEALSTNMPFTIFKNKGYTNLKGSEKILSKELDFAFNYAVLIDSFFVMSTFKDYPGVINKLERVDGNGTLSLYKKSSTNQPNSFFHNFIREAHSDFDENSNLPTSALQWNLFEEKESSRKKSLKIQEINEYSLTIRDTIKSKLEKPLRLQFVADYFRSDSTDIQMVVSLGKYYSTHYTISELDSLGTWERKQFSYKIDPNKFKVGDELVFYFWNPKKEELFIDNFNLIIYQ